MDVFACSIDDPTDGAGAGDATFCAGLERRPNGPGPAAEPGLAASASTCSASGVTVGGTALDTVCNAAGAGEITGMLSALVADVVPLSVCPTASGAGTVEFDSTPDDLRRIRIDVSWTRGSSGSVRQTTLLTNPLQS